MNTIQVELRGKLGDFEIEADFTAPASGVTALFGSSGSGKSSVLRAIAGLEPRLRGDITVAGRVLQDAKLSLPPQERGVGFVFQEPSLFPHLNVQENLNFGWSRTPTAERRVSPGDVIERLGLGGLLHRRTALLSGGERQRVALGRAVLASPRLLLLDEPLASLDGTSRREILPYLQALPTLLQAPVIYVSHSVAEVKWISNWVVFLEQGRVRGQGTLAELLPELNALDWTYSHSG